jgi:hypothetical protein
MDQTRVAHRLRPTRSRFLAGMSGTVLRRYVHRTGRRHAIALVRGIGHFRIGKRKINLSIVFAGHFVGIREIADKIWLVNFLDFALGYFDEAAARVEPGANPFASKVLTMPPV